LDEVSSYSSPKKTLIEPPISFPKWYRLRHRNDEPTVKPSELRMPPVASTDPTAIEIVRVWVAQNGQHVSLKHDQWPDPAAWGLLLADLARHLGNAYEQSGRDRADTVRRVREGFNAEMDNPTDQPTGRIRG
jgi:hypothetical protein